MSDVWRVLTRDIPRARLSLLGFGVLALVAGLADALALASVVSVVLASLAGDEVMLLSGVELSERAGLTLAAGGAVVTLASHLVLARVSSGWSAATLHGRRKAILDHYSASPWLELMKDRLGALQNALSLSAVEVSLIPAHIGNAIGAMASLCSLLLVAGVIDPAATAVIIGFGLAIALLLRPMAAITRRRASAFVKANSAFASEVAETAHLSLELAAYGVQREAARGLVAASSRVARAYGRSKFVARFGSTLYRDVAIVALVGAAAWTVAGDGAPEGGIGSVIVLVLRALASAQVAQTSMQGIAELRPHLVDLDARMSSPTRENRTGQPIDAIRGHLVFAGVRFAYPSSERDVLQGVDFELKPGELVALVGESGAGKTTVAQIALGLLSPREGRALIDGVDIGEMPEDALRRSIGFVAQEPRILVGSIAENVRFFRPWVTNAQVEEAVQRAGLGGFVQSLEQGLGEPLGHSTRSLSGGQKQRLAFARAIAGWPLVLVLDEPTSALDEQSAAALHDSLLAVRGLVTTLVVAHRPETVEVCDRVLVMADGRVAVTA